MSRPTQPNAEVHLKRAHASLSEIETATDELESRAREHNEKIDASKDYSFISSIGAGIQLTKQKSALISDLDLAAQELEHAHRLDPSVTIPLEKSEVRIGIPAVRAGIEYELGLVELAWGFPKNAEPHFKRSLESTETSGACFMLATVAEMQYRPVDALQYYEKCLAVDPAGENSVAALRGANAMRKYKKKFRGIWPLFCVMLPAWPVAIIYFFVKRK